MYKTDSREVTDKGQAAALVVLVCVAMLVMLMTAIAALGERVVDRARAQNAADAAALGSLDGGRSMAVDLAARHGAIVLSWHRGPEPHEVTVVVRIGDSTVTARATNAP